MTPKERRIFRADLWIKQDQRCALCKGPVPLIKTVLDHDHRTGYVRGVLHKHCNWMLGKIERAAQRSGIPNFAQHAAIYLKQEPLKVKYGK